MFYVFSLIRQLNDWWLVTWFCDRSINNRQWRIKLHESQRQKTYLWTCSSSTVWSESSLGIFLNTKDAKLLHADNKDWSDCANAQDKLSIRLVHISEGTFSHVSLTWCLVQTMIFNDKDGWNKHTKTGSPGYSASILFIILTINIRTF